MDNTDQIRILHVVTYMGRGGLETMIMNYYRHIDRSKVQFDFIVHRDFRADYDDEIEALGGRIFHLPRLVPWSRSYLKTLERFFRAHPEYKIVHVHQDCLSSVILKVAQKCCIPIRIAHSHSSSQDKNMKYLIKLFYKRFIPAYATQLFACGKKAGEWMFGGTPFWILNNAIDTNRYSYNSERHDSIRRKLQIPDSAFVIGHVGRFNTVKNHTFLLDVFAKAKEQNNNLMLLLVGDGNLRAEIEQKAASLGILSNVIFTGIRSDVPDLLQAMDCFVFPSHYEGLGIVVIEAQTAGLPCCISTGVPREAAITDLVQFRSLDDSPEQWAEWILRHVDTPRKDMSEEIRKAGYDIAETSKWLENYYLEAVKNLDQSN